jgi:hypothetical protein
MVKIFQKTILFLVMLALILFHPAFIHAEDTQGMPGEGTPAYKLKEATSFTTDIVPLIEDATGRKFAKIPAIKLVDRKKMTAILQVELKPQLKGMYPDYSEERLNELSSQQASVLAPAVMGKYGLLDHNLYLMPKNLGPLFKMVKVDSKYTQSILKLVIVHELIHALQDQQTDLKRFWNITSIDEINAFQATIEGHAVFIQDLLGREMGLDESVIEMSRLLSAGAVTFDDPAREMIKKLIATQYEQIYLGGKKFIEYHYQHGGNERVWEIIAKPPVKTAMIAHPETYSPVKQTQLNYAALLDGLEQELAGEDWKVKNIELGQMAMRSIYAKIPETDREEIISNIEHVQVFLAQNTDPPCIVSVSAIVLKNGDISKKYIALLEELARKNVDALKSSPTMQIDDFSIEDLTGIQADIARRVTFSILSKGKEEGQPQLFIRIGRGKLILEFFVSNFKMEDSLIIKIAEKVFERYQDIDEKKGD